EPADALAVLVGVQTPALAGVGSFGGLHEVVRRGLLPDRHALLHERHVPPGVRAQRLGVVVGLAGEPLHVLRHLVPLLARHLAGLAADADGRIREEAVARIRLGARVESQNRVAHDAVACGLWPVAFARYSSTKASSALPRGRRPGTTSQVAAFTSWMCTFGSSTRENRSFTVSPVTCPLPPQWYGNPTWWIVRPCTSSGFMRSVTITRA